MARFAVLLRGVNVGGRARVPMAQLRSALSAAGFDDVATLLQSGNVVLASERSAASVRREVERIVAEQTGVATTAFVLSAADVERALANNPFVKAAENDPSRLLLVFLDREVPAERAGSIDPKYVRDEDLAVVGSVLYVWYRSGIGTSKLTIDVVERALAVTATGRNWNTVTKLSALLA